jgi:hypothetical protein
VPAFQATGSSKPSEDSLPQPPYIVRDAAPIHGVPIEDLALRSVHRDGVQLAHRFRHLQSAAPHRLTRPTSAPFRAGLTPVSDQLCGNHSAEGPNRVVAGFLSPFDRRRSLLGSSCARWGGSAFLAVGLPAVDPPDPNGVVMLRMNKIRPGRAPPLPRGRWCAPGRRLSSGRHPPLPSGQSLRPR